MNRRTHIHALVTAALLSMQSSGALSQGRMGALNGTEDSTSVAFLMTMEEGQALTGYWERRFKEAFDHWSVHDPHVGLDLKIHWAVSDGVFVVIVGYATGVSWEEVAFTLRTDGTIVDHAHITSITDWDRFIPEWRCREFRVLDDRHIETIDRRFHKQNDEEPVEVDIRLVTIGMDGRITVE